MKVLIGIWLPFLALFLLEQPLISGAEVEECPKACSLPPKGGPCLGRKGFRMWYYKFETGECGKFSYGGCRGNKNKFWSLEECLGRCGACKTAKGIEDDICTLPLDQGNYCESSEVKPVVLWHFTTKGCEPFAYAGCGGNENKFDSHQQCEEKCGTSA